MRTTTFFNSIAALIITALLITACQSGRTNTDNEISFSTVTVEELYHMKNNLEYPNCNLQISFTYPVKCKDNTKLPELQALFVSSYFGDSYADKAPQEAANAYVQSYLEGYKEMEDDFLDDLSNNEHESFESWYSFYETSANTIEYNMNGLLSFSSYVETFTGGAHGSHSYTNRVIDLAGGTFLTESDIFTDGFQDELSDLLAEKIARQNNVADVQELENMGFFSVDEIYPNGNFLIGEKGITYTYNEYEIAAYVVGVINVEFTFKELQPLLLEESPISHLFSDR